MRDAAFALFDRLVFGSVLPAPGPSDIESINLAAHDARDDEQSRYRDFIYLMMGTVDTKVSALLTHISLIIAALVFIYSSKAGVSGMFKNMIMVEIVAYLILTVFCLRCIRMTIRLSSGSAASENDALAIELYKRRATYNWTSNVTVAVTVATIFTLVLGSVFGL
ncbi:hypothetical protein [Rhodoblastus sp.]|uniref:hypothetical protein n=1 Tax=Rhodoblastus sp. TaxID=1962975 RepID=UPI003F999504